MAIFCDGFVKRRNFFHRRACIKSLPRDRFACCIGPRNEKQVIYDSGQAFTFADGGFDGFAVLGGAAVPRQSHLCFAQHIRDRCPQFMCQICGELREPRKGIIEPL